MRDGSDQTLLQRLPHRRAPSARPTGPLTEKPSPDIAEARAPASSAEQYASYRREAEALTNSSDHSDYFRNVPALIRSGGRSAIRDLKEISNEYVRLVTPNDPDAATAFSRQMNRAIASAQPDLHARTDHGPRPGRNPQTLDIAAPHTVTVPDETEGRAAENPTAGTALGKPTENTGQEHQPVHRVSDAEARTAAAVIDEKSEAQGRAVFEENRPHFEALSEATGIQVERHEGTGVSVRFGGISLHGVDGAGMGRLAEEIAENPAIGALIEGALTKQIDLDRIEDRLDELGRLSLTPIDRGPERAGPVPYLTRELREERDRLRIVRDAVSALESGANADEIGDVLIEGFAPDPAKDREFAINLLLDVLPGIGEIRSIAGAVEDIGALSDAIQAGDWDEAQRAGLFAALGILGSIPGTGILSRAGRSALTKVLRKVPGGKKVLDSHRMARFSKNFPEDYKSFDFEWLLKDLDGVNANSVRGIINNLMGAASEAEVLQTMRSVGFKAVGDASTLRSGRYANASRKGERVYDVATPEGIGNFLSIFSFPTKRKYGSGVEVKTGGAKPSKKQSTNDERTRADGMTLNVDGDLLTLKHVEYMRVPLHEIDPDILRKGLLIRLNRAVGRGRMTQEQAKILEDRVMAYQKQSAPEIPIPLLPIMMIMSKAAGNLDDDPQ